jgi:hypothetical protein
VNPEPASPAEHFAFAPAWLIEFSDGDDSALALRDRARPAVVATIRLLGYARRC